MIKASLIVFDVDGTLINDQKDILPDTVDVVRELSECHGVEFVLASALSPQSLAVVSKKLGVDCGYVCFNGALSFYSKSIDSSKFSTFETIPSALASKLVGCLLDFDVTVSAFSKDAWVANRTDYWLNREIKGTFLQPDQLGREAIQNFVGQHGIHKFLCRGGEENIRRAKSAASSVVGEHVQLFSDRPTAIEISPAVCSKLNGIKALVSFHNHKDEDVWVFGDADNDLDMVNHYKNSVAMGNGSKTLKSAARHVIGTNNESSISKFLRNNVLR